MLKARNAIILSLAAATVAGGIVISGAGAFGDKKSSDQTPPAADQVWITRSDGAQSCSPKSGQSLEEGAADLKKAKVRVLDSHKGNDGKLHMQMCGAPSGTTNAYLIPKEDLPQAVAQGYVRAK